MPNLPDLGRYSEAELKRLLIYVLQETSSGAIAEAIAEIGTDEFNTISDAVMERERKESDAS